MKLFKNIPSPKCEILKSTAVQWPWWLTVISFLLFYAINLEKFSPLSFFIF